MATKKALTDALRTIADTKELSIYEHQRAVSVATQVLNGGINKAEKRVEYNTRRKNAVSDFVAGENIDTVAAKYNIKPRTIIHHTGYARRDLHILRHHSPACRCFVYFDLPDDYVPTPDTLTCFRNTARCFLAKHGTDYLVFAGSADNCVALKCLDKEAPLIDLLSYSDYDFDAFVLDACSYAIPEVFDRPFKGVENV